MDELKGKIGMVVKNDGEGLREALETSNLRHTGNYKFEARYCGTSIIISTEPQDDEGDYIKITNIRIHPDAVRKAGITYHMIRGKETAESFIDLPISQARYEELLTGLQPENTVWQEVRDALKRLAWLQGYDELGSWSIELTIEG